MSDVVKPIPMIIVVGPSGVGKSSFVDKITEELPKIKDVITYTTRSMREGETQGSPYHFVSQEDFLDRRDNGFFVEWAEVHGRLYGTPKQEIHESLEQGIPVIMDVDCQGAATFIKEYPGCLTLFIHPPSLDELKRRIVKRESKAPKDLEIRLKNAEKELGRASEFDVQLTNDEFDRSYAEFKKIVEDFLNQQ